MTTKQRIQLKDRVVRPIFSIILLTIVIIERSWDFRDQLVCVLLWDGKCFLIRLLFKTSKENKSQLLGIYSDGK